MHTAVNKKYYFGRQISGVDRARNKHSLKHAEAEMKKAYTPKFQACFKFKQASSFHLINFLEQAKYYTQRMSISAWKDNLNNAEDQIIISIISNFKTGHWNFLRPGGRALISPQTVIFTGLWSHEQECTTHSFVHADTFFPLLLLLLLVSAFFLVSNYRERLTARATLSQC